MTLNTYAGFIADRVDKLVNRVDEVRASAVGVTT